MNPDYYLGQSELASELKGFIENLRFDAGIKDGMLMDVLDAFLENKEKTMKELYLENAQKNAKPELMSPIN